MPIKLILILSLIIININYYINTRRVRARLDALLERLGAVLGAPRVGRRQPEQLVLLQLEARQLRLRAVPLDVALCKDSNNFFGDIHKRHPLIFGFLCPLPLLLIWN